MRRKSVRLILVFLLVLVSVILLFNLKSIEQFRQKSNLKIALLLSENLSTYDVENHCSAINALSESYKIDLSKILIKENVTEDNCFNIVEESVNAGYNLIFSVGRDLEDYIVQSATEHPKVQYCIADSKQAITSGMDNLHSYSLNEAESRYLAGVVAGMKLNDLIDNGEITEEQAIVGYVGTFDNAENISAYTAFYLGAKSVVPLVDMKVKFTESEYDEDLEKKTANALIANGCVLLVQQSNTNSIAENCEQYGVYYVGCLQSGADIAPNFAVVSTYEDWSACYAQIVDSIIKDEDLPSGWYCSIDTSAVGVTEINKNAFASTNKYDGTKALVAETQEKLKSKTLHIFDTANWKVNGETIASTLTAEFKADYGGVEYIANGRFMEYELTTLPKFAFKIDGIEILT